MAVSDVLAYGSFLYCPQLTQDDDFSWNRLRRDASGRGGIVYQQYLIGGTAGKALAIGRDYRGAPVWIEFQGMVRSSQFLVKIAQGYLLIGTKLRENLGLISGRINQRNGKVSIVKAHDAHSCAQRGTVHHVGVGGNDKLDDAVRGI